MLDAALAAKTEAQLRRPDLHVPILERGQAERLVGARILLVADANERGFEQPGHGREHLLPRQPGPPQIGRDPPAQPRQRVSERDHARVLGAVALLAPARVIAVLLAPARVPPRRLQVALGKGTDPDVTPGGRHGELANALQRRRVADDVAGRILDREGIDPATPLPHLLAQAAPPQPGPVVVDIAQAGGAGRGGRIDDLAIRFLLLSCSGHQQQN